jgi:predicted dehydrogenase
VLSFITFHGDTSMAIEGRSDARTGGRIRLGMVGGGEGAFIGAVHRIASRIDDAYEFVAGALSASPEKARRSGAALGLEADRVYDNYESMAKAEAARPDGIEAVAIVTPNHMHAGPAIAFLEAGIHVVCDKPLTVSLAEARRMQAAVQKSGRIFALTHNYTGYPLVRRMREMIRDGDLGALRLVQVEYAQDWLTGPTETSGNKQAEWRVDPNRSGAGGALGDIGTHAFNLADFVTGLDLAELSADLTSFGEGRALDDNVQISMRFKGGARGALWASQVAPGNENNLTLRVYGTKGGLNWRQEDPNRLLWSPYEKPTQILTRGGPGSGEAAGRVTRVPPGHPEGYLEGFANIYSEVAAAIRAARNGEKPPEGVAFPSIDDGVKGLAFIEAAVQSSRANGQWVKL